MASISKRLREQVTQRARGRCEYCHTPKAIVVEMAIDHILPESAGGPTVASNLCLACIGCNTYKREHQTGIDPQTGEEVRLFHPRLDDWHEHFQWSDDFTRIIGLTSVGRATIDRLRMNRDLVVLARRRWMLAGWKGE